MEEEVLSYKILDAVHTDGGNITQKDISDRVGCSVSSVNFALRLLAVKGYIKVSGANPKRLKYHLTPSGILEKTVLAYNFLKRQSALYEEARKTLLGRLELLKAEGVTKVAVYGWTPFTESGILYLISEAVQVTAIYVPDPLAHSHCNRIPIRRLNEFHGDCEVVALMEAPPPESDAHFGVVKQVICYPQT